MFDIQARAAMGGPPVPSDEIQMFVPDEVLGRLAERLIQNATNETGPFNNAVVHLFQNPVTPSHNSVIGDFTECNFTGYTASANLTFAAGLDDQGNHIAVADAPAAFAVTGDPAGQRVYGAYLTDHNATPRLIAAGAVVGGMDIVNGQLIPFTATLQVGNS